MTTDQVVIGTNAKQFPKVTEGDGGVGLEAKIAVVMSWSQVAAFTERHECRSQQADYRREIRNWQL